MGMVPGRVLKQASADNGVTPSSAPLTAIDRKDVSGAARPTIRGPKKMLTDITAEEVRSLVVYDPETGLFHHKGGRKWVKEGTRAGGYRLQKGYYGIALNKRKYQEHRVAWLYHYGEWPDGMIDHINRVKTDNRIVNLRVATPAQNIANSPAQKGNKAGAKGVYFLKKKKLFMVRIKDHGKGVYLGRFKKLEDARAAYERAAKRIHGEFAYIPGEQP